MVSDAIGSVIVPMRTVSEANVREHWSKRSKRVKAQRTSVAFSLFAYIARKPKLPELPLVVTLTRIAPRELDTDNLQSALKATRDSVAEWLGVDDRHDAIVSYRYAQRRGQPKEYAVKIEIGQVLYDSRGAA